MSILKVDGIEFGYSKETILDGVSFELRKGDCLAVLGTNGTGKSTLLKCLNRILKPHFGTVLIDSCEINKYRRLDLAKKIVYVSQKNECSRTTVFDAVMLGRRPYIKWDISEGDKEKVMHVIKTMGLEKFSLRYIDELSGGELQKVLIARALAQEPEILMLDEPTSSLDIKNQLELIKLIKDIADKRNIAAIVTIHDLNLALRFANRFILLKDGKIYKAGGIEIITPSNIEAVYSVSVDVENYRNRKLVIPV